MHRRLDAGQYQIQFEISYQLVDVRKLIDDVSLQSSNDQRELNSAITPLQQELNISKQQSSNSQYNTIYSENVTIITSSENKAVSDNTVTSRKIEISGGTVNASGAAAFTLGDISGTVANTSISSGKPTVVYKLLKAITIPKLKKIL